VSDLAPPAALAEALAERYAFRRELGRGGMATVYLAADHKHHREVALKVLRPDLAASIGSERFLKEIEIAARLTHPHILPLHDSGEAAGLLYYVMPYIDGGSLRQVLERERRLDLDRALGISRFVADALGYAHRMGVLHRDIKPENILFSQGLPVVADFGIAKAISTAGGANLTRTGFPLGTPGYMSPEQAAGLTELDERTDVYSLAVVVYEMLTGETPGHWPSEESVRSGRLLEAPASHRLHLARCPGHVEAALARAFAVRGDDRTATPARLFEDLHGMKAPAGPVESPPAAGRPVASPWRGHTDAPAKPDADDAAPSRPRRRYATGEVREIVRRAAELEASSSTASGSLTIGGIERLAEEALIPAEDVRRAAAAFASGGASPQDGGAEGRVGRDRGLPARVRNAHQYWLATDGMPDTPGQRAAVFWLGAPTYLWFERVVTGELPDVEFPALVELIRSELGQVGQVGQLGRSFSWSMVRGPGSTRDVQVLVSVRGGTTRVQVRENLGAMAGGLIGGLTGGLGGGGMGPILGILAGGLHAPVAALVAAPLWLVAVFSGARSAYYYSVKRRRTQLAQLADRLTDLAQDLVPARLKG
jgi:serine/threonine protein kinase